MDLGLDDRTAFIAGASSGLGYAVARQLMLEGCKVAICSRDEARIRAAAERLPYGTGATLPLVCDVTDEQQIEDALAETISKYGGLNILIANAGGPPSGFIEDFTADQWREALELNLISTINLCRHALPHLRKAAQEEDGLARILMITSVSAKQPIPNLYLSNTARAGVLGFAKSLSEELGPEGITVNSILPGYTLTERLGDLAQAQHRQTGKSIRAIEQEWGEANALKRLGTPEEFASAVAFLVSARASYITGVALAVDGGRVKGLL